MSYATEDSLERWGISQSIDERTVPCTHQLATPAGQGFQATLGIGRWVPGQPLAVPTVVVGIMILHAPLLGVIAWACIQVTLLSPIVLRFARLAWIYLDYRTDAMARENSALR